MRDDAAPGPLTHASAAYAVGGYEFPTGTT